MAEVDRQQMLDLCGIEYRPQFYTPYTIGKNNAVTQPRNLWARQFRDLNFLNYQQMLDYVPEDVEAMKVFYEVDGSFRQIDNRMAIVGKNSMQMYAIHSDKYEPIQHRVIIDAMANACRDTSLNVFGHFDEDGKGRFSIAFFLISLAILVSFVLAFLAMIGVF